MAQLLQIKNRKKSVESTLKITKAMKMIAAARLVKAKERVVKASPLLDEYENLLSHLKDSTILKEHKYSQKKTGSKVLYLLLSTDKGFCAGFNLKLFHYAQDLEKQGKNSGQEVIFSPIGEKAWDFFRKEKNVLKLSKQVRSIWEEELYNESRLIFSEIEALYESGEYASIHLVYNHFQSVLTQEPVEIQLLPLEPQVLEKEDEIIEFIFEPDEATLVNRILPTCAILRVLKGLVHTKAGEYGARMTAMDGANRNGEKLIRQLKIQFQRARQEAITTELAELIGGVECLRREQ